MKNLPIDKEVVNISKLIEKKSKNEILDKLKRYFEIANKFINTQNTKAPDNVIWIKEDEQDPDLLKLGFWKNSESTKPPRVKIDFKTSYFQKEKVRIIKCIIENALKEWENTSTSYKKKDQLLLPLNGRELNIIFE